MEAIWNDFNLTEKILLTIGLLFSLIFLLQMVLSLFGADHDSDASGHSDVSVSDDAGIPFQFITLKNMVAFFAIFGWTGLLCMQSGMAPWLSLLLAVLGGLVMMTIMASLVYFMSKLADDGTIDSTRAVGCTGDVYLIIPAKRAGQGKIHIGEWGAKAAEKPKGAEDFIPQPLGGSIDFTSEKGAQSQAEPVRSLEGESVFGLSRPISTETGADTPRRPPERPPLEEQTQFETPQEEPMPIQPGQEEPTIEQAQADFNVLGIQMRGFHDFGVKKQDPRGAIKMAGR